MNGWLVLLIAVGALMVGLAVILVGERHRVPGGMRWLAVVLAVAAAAFLMIWWLTNDTGSI